MTFHHKAIFFFTILLMGVKATAQVYPVNGNAALIPPYSVYLSDYTSRSTERLVLNVVLNDVTRPELRVRLRMKIESQSIKLETKSEYIGPEIILQGGIPLRLSGTDLTEYFNPNNLNFTGITRKEFEKTGALPEGFYQFSFEVLEYNRGVKISNAISAPGWLILNDPPIVNLPHSNEKLKPTLPQNLIFQWTPRHTGSPNSAFATEYSIEMVEVWPATRNPNDAILTSPRILETTTRSTSFIFGPAETPLELGRRYALRIQAKSIVGAEELDLFKNHGYSEVITFVYGDACEMPGNISVQTGTNKFKVLWSGQFNHSAYSFRYRQEGTTNWYESSTPINEMNVYSLTPNTSYEYQVAGTCGVFGGEYSPIATLKTIDVGSASYSCGLPLETFNLDPAELTASLKVGDIIQAGDFQVKLTKVSGSNGIFTGEGVIEVPFFNKAKVKAEFNSIAVNKELRMVNGFMNVTGAGVEVVPSGVMDLMDDLDEALTQIDSVLTNMESNLPQTFDPNSFVADTLISITGEIEDVYKDLDGTIVIVDQQGKQTRLPQGEDYAIKDDKGNGYLVDSKGGIHKTTAENAVKAANREYNLSLKFTADPIAKYGFDELPIDESGKYDVLKNSYDQIENKNVAWKAVASGATDPVTATLEDASLDKSKIRFELFSLPVQAPPLNSNLTTTVTLTGKSDGTIEDLIALYSSGNPSDKEQVLGKLKVITYDKIVRHLVIVPVNNNTYPGTASQLVQDLNKIFGQAAVEWSVEIATTPLEVSLDETFDDGESGLLSNYTDDMKKVINKYDINDDAYYLFLVNKPKSGNKLGYMPRSKQAGFIFVDQNGNDVNKLTHTIAHELGHGVFNLQHTFSEFNTLTSGTTDNLMDYSNGTHLFKYQWDDVHQPPIVIGLFEGDEAGALSLPCWGWFDDCDDVLAILKGIKQRVETPGAFLPLFKPDQSKNRGEMYAGNYLTVADTDYDRILIMNGIAKDTAVNPKNYYDFSVKLDNDIYQAGFMYKPNANSNFKILIANEDDSVTTFNKVENLRKYLFNGIKPIGEEAEEKMACSSGFCCSKCGKDLKMTDERFSELFPNVTANKPELINALNLVLQEEGFEYNTCDRQAKIFAQITVETNGLTAKVEAKGKTWKLLGDNQLLTYFKATLGAKQQWFNQAFWNTKKYKDFCQIGYYESLGLNETIPKNARYKSTDTTKCYGYYQGNIQENYLVKVPSKFVSDTTGQLKLFSSPTSSEKLLIEKRIFNYAYGGSLGNGDYTTDDGYNYRGRGGIQLTGRGNYEALDSKLKVPPYNLSVDIVSNPNLVAEIPKIVIFSAFIHFKSQLKNDISKLDNLPIDRVSALVNTGKEEGTANHETQRRDIYDNLKMNEFKCPQ